MTVADVEHQAPGVRAPCVPDHPSRLRSARPGRGHLRVAPPYSGPADAGVPAHGQPGADAELRAVLAGVTSDLQVLAGQLSAIADSGDDTAVTGAVASLCTGPLRLFLTASTSITPGSRLTAAPSGAGLAAVCRVMAGHSMELTPGGQRLAAQAITATGGGPADLQVALHLSATAARQLLRQLEADSALPARGCLTTQAWTATLQIPLAVAHCLDRQQQASTAAGQHRIRAQRQAAISQLWQQPPCLPLRLAAALIACMDRRDEAGAASITEIPRTSKDLDVLTGRVWQLEALRAAAHGRPARSIATPGEAQ